MTPVHDDGALDPLLLNKVISVLYVRRSLPGLRVSSSSFTDLPLGE